MRRKKNLEECKDEEMKPPQDADLEEGKPDATNAAPNDEQLLRRLTVEM